MGAAQGQSSGKLTGAVVVVIVVLILVPIAVIIMMVIVVMIVIVDDADEREVSFEFLTTDLPH